MEAGKVKSGLNDRKRINEEQGAVLVRTNKGWAEEGASEEGRAVELLGSCSGYWKGG